MQAVKVAVGSTRRPKLDAVREALAVVGPLLDPAARFDVVGVEVPSGVAHTPVSRAELMTGARQRSEGLKRIANERGELWNYFVGLEGGLEVTEHAGGRWIFLVNWAYVLDATGRGTFGYSGGILMPDALSSRVVDDGIELAEAVDAFAGDHRIRDKQGAWGILSRDLVKRQDAFRAALLNAFAPFYNARLYSSAYSGCEVQTGEI